MSPVAPRRPCPPVRPLSWALLALLLTTGCLGTGAPPAGVPAPGSGRFNLVEADFRETPAGLRHETRADWVWTTASQEGRLYGFLAADQDGDRDGLPPVVADLHLDAEVARLWLAQATPLALRHGPGAFPTALVADPGPAATRGGGGDAWLQAPLRPLLPGAQVVEGGRRARLTLFDDQRRPVFRLLLPPPAFADFEQGLAAALAARDAAVAEQAATLAEPSPAAEAQDTGADGADDAAPGEPSPADAPAGAG